MRRTVTSVPASATIYCRISSDPTGQAAGVDRQERECRELCHRLGFDVAEVIVDNDVSATRRRPRHGFERLLASAPEVVVVWHTDRLVRLTADLERVIALGVNVHAVTAGHLDLSNPAGRAVARTVTAWATYEGEQKAERQKAAHRQRREAGRTWWSHRPFGYEKDGTLREIEAAILRDAYRAVLTGRSNAETARIFNEAGLSTTHGNAWTGATIHQLLVHPRSAGLQSYMGESTGELGTWVPIVAEEDWLAARRLLTTPGRRPGRVSGKVPNLLTGIATCERCWRTMRVGSRPSYRIYQCGNCHGSSVPLELADRYIKELISQYIFNFHPSVMTPPAMRQEHEKHQVDVSTLRDARERLTEVENDYADAKLSRAAYERMSARLRERVTALEAQLADERLAQEGSRELTKMASLTLDEVRSNVDSLGLDRLRDLTRLLLAQVRIKSVGRKGRYMRDIGDYVEIVWREEVEASEGWAYEEAEQRTP